MRLLACLAAMLIAVPALAAADAQSEALWQRADALMQHNQYQQALPLLLDAAERGHPRAQVADRRPHPPRIPQIAAAQSVCLQQLRDDDRLVVEQRYSRQMSVAEIAGITGRNTSTLYKALERIRRQLFECVNRRLQTGCHH